MAQEKPLGLIPVEEAKRWLRRYLIRRRQAIAPSDKKKWSRAAVGRLVGSSFYKQARVIAAFIDFGSEISTDGLLENAWKAGKKVLIPITAKGLDRPYFALFKKGDRLKKTAFGPLELSPSKAAFPFGSIDLVILPGLGFDDGHLRLGYGGGVYDRILEKTPRAKHVGLFFSNQRLPALPRAPHDRKMSAVVTERGIHLARAVV